MKKILFIFFLLFSINLYSQTPESLNMVDVYYKDKKIGEYTKEEFSTLILSSLEYEKLLVAEQNKKIIVQLKDDPFVIPWNSEFTTSAYIIWFDETNKPIKTVTIQLKFKKQEELPTRKTALDAAKELYVPVATSGFPIVLIICIIAIIL